jgi:hypothetical protein
VIVHSITPFRRYVLCYSDGRLASTNSCFAKLHGKVGVMVLVAGWPNNQLMSGR